ncbi:MAG: hypothetical protein ACOZNI_07545 [Myxococcota bacterium]
MSVGASESVVAAADAPIPFLRAHAGVFLRIVGPMVLVSQLALVPAQFMQGTFMDSDGSEVLGRFAAYMGVTFGGVCVFWLMYPVIVLVIYAVATDLLAGREPTLLGALRRALDPMKWLTGVVVGLFTGVGAMTIVGAPVAVGFFAFTYPVMFEERVAGVEAVRRSLIIARYGAGAAWWTAPWARVAVAFVAWWGLSSALGTLAAIPIYADMGWSTWQAFTRGEDPAATIGRVSPLASVIGALLGAGARVVTDSYPCVLAALVYHDVRRRMGGADLEARIAALEAAR